MCTNFLVLRTPTVGVPSELRTLNVSSPYSFATLCAMHFCRCTGLIRLVCLVCVVCIAHAVQLYCKL